MKQLTIFLALLLCGCYSAIEPSVEPFGAQYAGVWQAAPSYVLQFSQDGTTATMPNIGTATVMPWEARVSADGQLTSYNDTLLHMAFSDSITTVNVWTHGNDSLTGDIIHGVAVNGRG